MNLFSNLNSLNLCGIYELDSGGRIIYCGMHSSDGYFKRNTDLIGSNFFDIARFENIEDFRRRIKYFLQNSNPTEDFNFDCRFSESVSNVKVRLVRVSEREPNENSSFVIVDIRRL
jgi:hypothetical protein